MATHFNQLTPAEAERLALLSEELGEAQQAIGKILRHGYESVNPFVEDGPTNREALERELGDVEAAIRLLVKATDLDGNAIVKAEVSKLQRVGAFLHHQPRSGN
jgi:NTP pyrophosphatase (non-canonical NTP hydrolase)